jgi:hypothetical protein
MGREMMEERQLRTRTLKPSTGNENDILFQVRNPCIPARHLLNSKRWQN